MSGLIPQFREDLAWAAGFFEGEGHVGSGQTKHILKNGMNFVSIRALIVQTNLDPINKFHNIVNIGWVGSKKLYSPLSKKPQFQWQVQSYEGVQYLMGLFWNYLSIQKRAQFVTALESRKRTWQ